VYGVAVRARDRECVDDVAHTRARARETLATPGVIIIKHFYLEVHIVHGLSVVRLKFRHK
jgi:hypothetical protein